MARRGVPLIARALPCAVLCAVACAPAWAWPPGCDLGCNFCCWLSTDGAPIWHHQMDPCVSGGSFDLSATQYRDTCYRGMGCPILVPPIRFWEYDDYAAEGHACSQLGDGWIANSALDFFATQPVGRWILYQAAFQMRCAPSCFPSRRAVAELSFVDDALEGTVEHGSRYLIASVDGATDFDFDRITGGDGCNEHEIAALPVAGLRLAGSTAPCRGGAAPIAARPHTCHFADVDVELEDPSPLWWSESGRQAAPPLIAGYQILYAMGHSLGDEPTTSASLECAPVWKPVRDPADPMSLLAVVPLGRSAVTVTLPTEGMPPWYFWLATRLVYQDASVNQPSDPHGPWLYSEASRHCGPVQAPLPPGDPFPSFTLDDGVPASTEVPGGAPILYAVRFRFEGDADDAASIHLGLELPDCLDLARFDPALRPEQVLASPVRASFLDWNPATRRLDLGFYPDFAPGMDELVVLSDLYAPRPPVASTCCSRAELTDSGCRVPQLWSEDAEGSGPTCTTLAGPNLCPTPPAPVTGVRATKAGVDVVLTWAHARDLATSEYHVWKVLSGDPTLIPVANDLYSGSSITEVPGCVKLDLGQESCLDVRAVHWWPALAYYQVRGACSDGEEGRYHPY